MRGLFVAVVVSLGVGCLEWDPRPDGGVSGGGSAGGDAAGGSAAGGSAAGGSSAGGNAAGGSAAGGNAAGGNAAGGSAAGGSSAGGNAAGGSAAGGNAAGGNAAGGNAAGGNAAGGNAAGGAVAGGSAGGAAGGASIVPIANAGDGGDYLTTGGCGPTDGGARCHPWCTPGVSGDAGTDAGCCLDDECASGQCFGAPTNRRCVPTAQRATINQACGDETDCFDTGIACDVRRLSCSDTILSSLGDADAGTRCFLGGSSTSCSLLPDISDYYCALPGQTPGQAGNPCCYDRTDAGIWVTCLLTGNCYCTMDMGCGSNAGARCPF